tara:strand:- start:338 stop:610 length:273 start_codon:yes stop_codon:yes gene_type:complete
MSEMLEHSNKPYVTIKDVRVYVEELPEEGQRFFGRLQRLITKKTTLTLDLEEVEAGILFFGDKIVSSYTEDMKKSEPPQEQTNETNTEES